MAWFLYAMGSFELLMGILIVLYTQTAIEFINGLLEKANWRIFGLIALLLGVILMIAAWWSKYFWGILILGIIASLKGVFYLFAPLKQIDIVLNFWRRRTTEIAYRLLGLTLVMLGIFILAAA